MLIGQKKLVLLSTYAANILALSGPVMADNTVNIEERLSALESNQQSSESTWIDRVEFGGIIEIEASYDDPESGSSSSDLVVATAELDISAVVTNHLSASITLLYEEDEGSLDTDVASLTYAPINSPFSVTIGQEYVPFGAYETALVNDPLTLDIGETRETAAIVYYQNELLNGAVYIFNGDQDEDGRDAINSFGGRLAVGSDTYNVGIDYTNNIADSDGLQENDYGYATGEDAVGATTVYGSFNVGAITVVGEYLTVLDEMAVDGLNSEPSAAHIEVALNSGAMTYAASYQQTDEAVFLELPETRMSVGVSRVIADGVGLSFQIQRDDDYGQGDGGSGDSSNSVVIQLAAEF